jgi:hypothetical protein
MKFLRWYRNLFWADKAVFVFMVAGTALILVYAGALLIVVYCGDIQ